MNLTDPKSNSTSNKLFQKNSSYHHYEQWKNNKCNNNSINFSTESHEMSDHAIWGCLWMFLSRDSLLLYCNNCLGEL